MKPLLSGYVQGQPTGGPECEHLERELESAYGVNHARVLNSATSALHASLIALGIGPGDEVLVPAYSMSASASCVLHAGATPVFCDISDDYCIDWADAFSRVTPRTKAAIVVHLFGHHAAVPNADAFSISVIHDCAQSPSFRPGLPSSRSELYVYSLNQHKIISSGEGGYVLSHDLGLSSRIHAVRNHGESTTDILGYNYRMVEPVAKIARAEFADLDARLVARRAWAKEIRARHDLPDDPGNQDWYMYPMRVSKNREEYAARIPAARVGYQPLIPDMTYFKSRGYSADFPHARLIESEIIVIPPEAYGL